VTEAGEVTVVRLVDRRLMDEPSVQELARELFRLVDVEKRGSLLLNFSAVDYLSSGVLGKLITLEKKLRAAGGKLTLTNLRPEIREVFAMTRLDQLFDIRDDEVEALAALSGA
jgi:anti-sigma B factor antagonist